MAPMLALALALAAVALAEPADPADPGAPPPPAESEVASESKAVPAAAPAPARPQAPATPPQPGAATDEAPKAYVVEKVTVVGLEKSRSRAVRRHLLVRAGDVLDDRDVLLSRLRLLQLGWFSKVEARIEKGTARGLVVLVFDVVERNTIVVTDFVLGTTDPQPLYGGLGITEQNFLGRGYSLAGAFVYGGAPLGRPTDPDRFALRGSFFAPDVPIRGLGRLVAGATAWTLRGEELACEHADCAAYSADYSEAPRLRYRRTGGDLSAGIRTGPFDRVLLGWRLDAVEAEDLPGAPGSPYVPPHVHSGSSWVSALLLTWERDTRNDTFLPREGHRLAAQLVFGSRLFGSDYEFSRYSLQAESAFAVAGLPLRIQLQAGAVQGDAPFFDRFYAADLSYFAVGPALGRALELNFSTDSRYDAFAAMAGLEWAVPLKIRGRFFQRAYLAAGARAVWSTAALGGGRRDVSAVPFSADVALRFDTPIGAFNASIGYALDNLL
jgi:outer membrane protein assembly factor BamA